MTSSVASRPGFLRWLVTAGDPATLVATFSTAAGSPVNLSGSTVAAACANWSTSHAGSATVGGASNNEVTVAFTDTITGQLTGGGWTWTLTVDGVTTLAGPLDVAQPGVAGVTGGDASAVVVVDDVNVAVTVVGGGGGGAVDSVNGQTGVVVLGAADVSADPAGTAAGLVDDLSGVSNQAQARTNLGLGSAAVADTGTGSSNVILGNDSRLTDARTPTTHAATHADGGSDEISIDASQITTGTVDQARLGTGSAGAGTKFLADDQTYKTVSSGIADPGGSNDDFLQRKSGAWANRTIAQVKTDLGITDRPPPTAKVVGYYAPSGLTAGNMTSPLTAAGTMAAAPVWLWAGSYTEVGNAYHYSGTSTVRFGLYDATGTGGYPGSLVSGADFGTISCVNGSPGAKSIAISFTLATSGWYWIAALCDAYTSTCEFVGYPNTNGYGPMKVPGFPTYGDTNGASCVTKTGVSTGSMPSTFGTPTVYVGTRFPVIRLYLNS